MILKDRDELKAVVSALRNDQKRIVTCNGAFDIVHAGHVKFLQEAKEQGDILIVGLNSDSSIKRYKSKDRPINPQDARAAVLDAFSMVDYVVIFDEETPLEFLKAAAPDVHCNGEEYGKDCIEAPLLKELGAKLHLIGKYKDYSTTNILKRAKK